MFEKYSNSKFRENPSSGSRVVACGRTDIVMSKLTVAFRNFANSPKSLYQDDPRPKGKNKSSNNKS